VLLQPPPHKAVDVAVVVVIANRARVVVKRLVVNSSSAAEHIILSILKLHVLVVWPKYCHIAHNVVQDISVVVAIAALANNNAVNKFKIM
jgi:hypothetical protein